MLCSQLLSCAGIAGSHQQQLHRMTSLALAFVVLVPAVSSSCKGFGLLSLLSFLRLYDCNTTPSLCAGCSC